MLISVLDILLMPFVLLYRGFIMVLLSPYYLVIGISKLFGGSKNNAKVKAELKKGEKIEWA